MVQNQINLEGGSTWNNTTVILWRLLLKTTIIKIIQIKLLQFSSQMRGIKIFLCKSINSEMIKVKNVKWRMKQSSMQKYPAQQTLG